MPDPDGTYWMIRENARRLTEEQARLREAARVRSAHSRTGLLAKFLRRLADRIDPTGDARRSAD